MIVLQILEAYFAVAGLFSVIAVALLCHFRPGDPLRMLDGRALGSALDDSDRERLIDAADARLTTLVELNQTWDLPTREPRA
jgi:hypothetical protein